MTAIERTAYPRFTRAPSVKELRDIYTPTPGDVAFVATKARGPSQKFALMILLKVYQRLHYFPEPQTIPTRGRAECIRCFKSKILLYMYLFVQSQVLSCLLETEQEPF